MRYNYKIKNGPDFARYMYYSVVESYRIYELSCISGAVMSFMELMTLILVDIDGYVERIDRWKILSSHAKYWRLRRYFFQLIAMHENPQLNGEAR